MPLGAWEKVDVNVSAEASSDSKEFEDDYDPKAEADKIGQAFGDYKQPKKKKKKEIESPLKKEFEDEYKPGVDRSDPLADAFGDGFRAKNPDEVCQVIRSIHIT